MLNEVRWGCTPQPHLREIGSILTEEAGARRLNFTSDEANALYESRRSIGWGIDPVRCLQYLISSQALMINICGPLFSDHSWLIAVLRRILGRSDLLSVETAEIEYAPRARSSYLGDMTHLDALLVVKTESGSEVVVMEFKYADRFNSRVVDISRNLKYQDLAQKTGLWINPSSAFTERKLNQLIRCHALGARIADRDVGQDLTTNLVVVHHALDHQAKEIVDLYRGCVVNPQAVKSTTLDEVLNLMKCHASIASQRATAEDLLLRYGNEPASEKSWLGLTQRSVSSA